MSKFVVTIGVSLTAILFLPLNPLMNGSTVVLASDSIRIAGYGEGRSRYLLSYNGGPPPGFHLNYTSRIYYALVNRNNFGPSGISKCEVSEFNMRSYLHEGDLVGPNNELFADVFFAPAITTDLAEEEAIELARFIVAGGVVILNGDGWVDLTPGRGPEYNLLFEKLGIEDRFSAQAISQVSTQSLEPEQSVITVDGPFGSVGPLSHRNYRLFENHYLKETVSSDDTNGLVFESKIGNGYLSVSGTSLFLNGYITDPDNMKYMLNAFALGCNRELEDSITPFLDLPWNYSDSGLSFSDAALAINSYFDHKYPLLSTSLAESEGARNTVVNFSGIEGDFWYSGHDGYDWGRKAKATLGSPVLAGAGGIATFVNSCKPCGNAIHIDHENGFQTRYYHLGGEGLVVSEPGVPVRVEIGDMIGKVGLTGRTTGAHIHFMVIEDKDKDGNFNNNIPDGLTDPFGWQSQADDPWPLYSFNYAGSDRNGNKSNYLFTNAIANLSKDFDSNGAFFNLERYGVEFPQGFTDKPLKVKMKAAGGLSTPLPTLGYPFDMKIVDASGLTMNSFYLHYELTMDLNGLNLDAADLSTISFYSSEDGKNWIKENSVIDWVQKKISALINHASYFAVMAEKLDEDAPETTSTITGTGGKEGWYRSDVELVLSATDSGLGVDYTAIKVNDDDWEVYSEPRTFTQEGSYDIEFYSADLGENIEEVKNIHFEIDKTAPEAEIYFNPKTNDTEIKGIDDHEVEIKIESGTGGGILRRDIAVITDMAGNELVLDGYVKIDSDNDFVSIVKLFYNGQEYNPSPNSLRYNAVYGGREKKLNILQQTWHDKDGDLIKIIYNAAKDESMLIREIDGVEMNKEILPGLVLLYIQTIRGELGYNYS